VQEKTRAACENFAKDPRFGQFWSQTGQSKLAANILSSLLKGAKTLPSQHFEGVLTPARVAEFLAWIACCDDDGDVPWAVKTGLKWLGIERQTKKRGRPSGKKSNYDYFVEFRARSLVIDRTAVWALKKSLQVETPHRWQARLRESLQGARWSQKEIDALIVAKTPRSLAIQLTAYEFGVEYDTVQKAIWTYGRQSTQDSPQPGKK
jgi:hypothetical protein